MAIYDALDFYLIQSIYSKKKKVSTWELTKQYFKDDTRDKKQRMRNLNYKHQLVKQRLKKMAESGFLYIHKNGGGPLPLEYFLIKEKVKFCKHKFPCGYKDAVLIQEDNKWMAFQI